MPRGGERFLWWYAPRGATGRCGLAPPPHAAPGDGIPRGRHGVGTEHTRGGEASGRARARAPSRLRGAPGVGGVQERDDTVRRA
eukprot:2666470-Prymnesium_polylepis.1